MKRYLPNKTFVILAVIFIALGVFCKGNFFSFLNGRDVDAKESFKKITKAEEEQAEKYFNEAALAGKNNDYEKAIELFNKTLEINPSKTYTLFCLGYIYEVSGKLKLAIESYEKYSFYESNNPEVFYNLGNCYMKLMVWQKAIDNFLKAVDINPKHVDAWVNLSIASSEKGEYKNALKYCETAILLGYVPPKEYIEGLRSKVN